jgi:hypothetical protein
MDSALSLEKASRLICVRQLCISGGRRIRVVLLDSLFMALALSEGTAFRLIYLKQPDITNYQQIKAMAKTNLAIALSMGTTFPLIELKQLDITSCQQIKAMLMAVPLNWASELELMCHKRLNTSDC